MADEWSGDREGAESAPKSENNSSGPFCMSIADVTRVGRWRPLPEGLILTLCNKQPDSHCGRENWGRGGGGGREVGGRGGGGGGEKTRAGKNNPSSPPSTPSVAIAWLLAKKRGLELTPHPV